MLSIRDKGWSPYVAGVLIGLLQIPAFLIIDTALGASSSFVTIAGHFSALFDPAVGEESYFSKYMTAAVHWWQTALIVGIALGAFVSARFSGAFRQSISPIWAQALGTASPGVRYFVAFFGGFVLLFGARLAGGCTSGHGISGLSQLAVGSTIVVAAMFAGGIATAMLMRRIG